MMPHRVLLRPGGRPLVRELLLLTNAVLPSTEVLPALGLLQQETVDWFGRGASNDDDIRIQSLLEVEAFDNLLRDWKRLGYPFDNITPSYATSIGSSGDRPAALAELMSILVNDGVRVPMVSLTGLHFAANTPFDTRLSMKAPVGERLMPVEVARTVRRALANVVEGGTASEGTPAHLLATNVYVKTPRGWRIVLHHVSIAPGGAPSDAPGAQILH